MGGRGRNEGKEGEREGGREREEEGGRRGGSKGGSMGIQTEITNMEDSIHSCFCFQSKLLGHTSDECQPLLSTKPCFTLQYIIKFGILDPSKAYCFF